MASVGPKVFVGAQQLSARMKEGGVKVFDCSFYLSSENRNPLEEWRQKRIPGASFFDIDQVCDPNSSLPHMLPTPDDFWDHMEKEGDFEEVVLYDASRLYKASARVFWMCKLFGLDEVSILDGGLQSWEQEGLDLERGEENQGAVSRGKLRWDKTVMKTHLLYNQTQIKALSEERAKDPSLPIILDARGAGRFWGEQKEARAGLRSGHIPNSDSLPFIELFPEGGGSFLPQEVVKAKFEKVGVKFGASNPPGIVTSCGSGVTAAVLSLALNWCGVPEVAMYDGSWTEWAQEGNGMPVVGKGGQLVE